MSPASPVFHTVVSVSLPFIKIWNMSSQYNSLKAEHKYKYWFTIYENKYLDTLRVD